MDNNQKKQAVILYSASLLGILLGVLSSIVNTRYIDPADYGNVRYVQNILNFFSSILLLGFFQSGSRLLAISDSKKFTSQVKGCMLIVLGITLAIQMLCCFFCGLMHTERADISSLFWISIPVCGYPLFLNYMNTTAQGDNQIFRLSIARLLPSLIYVPIAYIVYKTYGATAEKLILMQWGIAVIVLLIIIISTKPSFNNIKEAWQKLKLENKSYGLQLYWGSLFMVASGYLAGIFLGLFNNDNTNVGFYTLALTVTSPLAMLPAIVGTTYFKKFAREPKIPSRVMKFTIILTIGSCILFILIIQPIVTFLYSRDYSQVGIYASWLALGFSIHGFGDMLNRYLGSHGQGKQIRNASIFCGLFKIFGFSFLVWLWNINGALLTVVISDLIYLILMYTYYLRFIKLRRYEV